MTGRKSLSVSPLIVTSVLGSAKSRVEAVKVSALMAMMLLGWDLGGKAMSCLTALLAV